MISALGALAFISAVLIAWPALVYLGAKMFNQESVRLLAVCWTIKQKRPLSSREWPFLPVLADCRQTASFQRLMRLIIRHEGRENHIEEIEDDKRGNDD